MSIPISSSLNELNANSFFREGFELSLDAIVPSVELTGSFSQFESKTQLFIYNYSKTILHSELDYKGNGSYLLPSLGTSTTTATSSIYNQFELNPVEDVYNLGYSNGKYFASYNFVNYELGSELSVESITPADEKNPEITNYGGYPYFIKDISGDRTELRIQNNFLSSTQIETFYNSFETKLNSRQDADEFYISFGDNRNFIAVNSQLEKSTPNSLTPSSILIKLYKPLPSEFEVEEQIQIISKVGETRVFEIEFKPNLQFIDNLLSLKGPNYNIDIKDKVNNSSNFKNLNELINTNSSQSYYQFNSLQDQKGVAIRKNWGDWKEFVKYSSAEQRLSNFYDKMSSIESFEAELLSLETITGNTLGTVDYSSSYGAVTNNINNIISKFDSYEYFLYYVTGSESWPKYTSTYPYTNYSVSSSAVQNWYGSTDESSLFYNSGKNQIFSASIYDENNQDYLYYLIPPFITENTNNNQYTKFVNMTGQAFDEMYIYTEALEQVRNTNSGLTGSVLPLDMADEVITSLGFDTYGNNFNSVGFNVNNIGVFPAAGSGLEYITRYVDIASGSVINYYDTQQSTLGYVISLADPSFPYPIENTAQEIYKRIFHNAISLVKRKGTVTGLRQLINIWGVPNTMLRISEFGGKNKDDENDYDLWMNRYSNAMSTIPTSTTITSTTKSSGSIRIPWLPLTSNYYEEATNPEIAIPDCIQFRFKNKRLISSDSIFSQSLLVKNKSNSSLPSDFGIVLQYSGSQSGSFSGSVIPTDYQYGTMQFVISGSVSEGGSGPGYFETEPITLPFFNNDWWSVQLQRKTHISQSQENATLNEYELRVANNIYDGYDGNQIGFQGSASITMPGGKITSSINQAWNKFSSANNLGASNGILLGGYMNKNTLSGFKSKFIGIESTGRNIGTGFIGQFQEFRYYRRALSSSQFNDYVMNPESIQGHSDSTIGAGSSYDLLSYRLPLGNELEYNDVSGSGKFSTATENGYNVGVLLFGGQNTSLGSNGLGSVHPSLVNKKGTLYTSSFLNMNNYTTQSGYAIVYQGWDGTETSAVTASYLTPNTEINYMDQPAAGIRNRIKNKIQVIDGNEYGTTLSPFRSIQQEFEQSSSYTEDLNSLEVGFSFQNEINDDIIATFGHGVVSDAIADPRFISESSDRYPELTRIAEDYFKKYQGVTISDPTYNGGLPTIIEKEYDYNRLIKFYESSLFRAIKNYIPARTSLSTGIIVKQHLLERNKTNAVVGINTDNPIAKTPETGSNAWGYTTQTGFNSVISNKNLLITSSIAVGFLTGSAGGSVNKYNVITNEGRYFEFDNSNITLPQFTNVNLFPTDATTPPAPITQSGVFLGTDFNGKNYLESEFAFRSQIRFNPYFAVASAAPGVVMTIEMTSSIREGIFTNSFPKQTAQDPPSLVSENYVDIYPGERIYVYINVDNTDSLLNPMVLDGYHFEIGESTAFDKPEPKSSQQVNWYRDDYTGLLKVKDTQEEFYDGEFSGSEFRTAPTEYNPYRIFADGSNLNPDQSLQPGYSAAILNLAATPYNTTRFPTVTATAATAVPIRATGSLLQYSGSYNGVTSGDALLIQDVSPNLNNAYQWVKITSEDGITRTYNAIGTSNSRFYIGTYPAQEKQFILSEETDIFRTQTDGGIFSGTVLTAGTKTEDFTDQYGKKIEVALQWNANSVISATITNNNLGNDNGSLWPKADSVFTSDTTISFSGNTLAFTLSSAASLNNQPAFGVPNLLMVQFIYSGANFFIAGNFKNAIESSNGHNGSLLVTQHSNQGASNRYSLQLFNTVVGNTYVNAIQGSTLGTNDFADNSGGICVLDEGGGNGDYYFPTTIQQGVDQPANNPTIYLQNAITNLTPGVTYNISFNITNYATDGFGNSNFDVGLSSNDIPGGSANGIGLTARATSNAAISHSWVQAAGTTKAQFFSATGTYANISNVNLFTLDSILAPKHLYPLDAFTIIPTGSQLFQNSSYNPLLHNVSGSRENSFLLDQDFDPVSPGFKFIEGIPNDYTLLISASQLGWKGVATADNLLEFSEVPDSNYTTTAIINPRYNGSKVTSADYNFYTGIPSESKLPAGITGLANPSFLLTQNKIQYTNGETGSWTGDISYGKTAAINRNPINIAHFKSSLESKEYFGTTTFNIDQLIQIPFEEILNEQSPIITSSLINGSNENLIPMSSTFMYGRKATIVYNQTSKTFNNIGGAILKYTNLGIGSNIINAGGINFEAYQSNERALDVLTTTQFYDLPIWYNYKAGLLSLANQTAIGYQSNPAINITANSSSIKLTSSLYPSINSPFTEMNQELPMINNLSQFATGSSSNVSSENSYYTNAPNVVMGVTGSLKDEDNKDVGIINIKGPNVGKLASLFSVDNGTSKELKAIKGPSLMLFNSINTLVKFGDVMAVSSSTIQSPIPAGGPYNGFNIPVPLIPSSVDIFNARATSGLQTWGKGSLPILPIVDRQNRNNYFKWNISSSQLPEYRDMKKEIIIERGDEIRVSYAYEVNDGVKSILSKVHQDFTVLGYHQLPPALFTNNDICGLWPEVRMEIASYKVTPPEPQQVPSSPGFNTRTTYIGPLPKDGYYSFSSLLNKYKASLNNNDRISITTGFGSGVPTAVQNRSFSGSLTGINTHTVVDGTGIIGLTASMDGSSPPSGIISDTTAFNLNYNYVSQLSASIPTYSSAISTAPYINNLISSASVNPGIEYTSYTQLLDPGYFFDRVIVTPNPTELENKIPTGRIYAMTLRKRVEADDRVVLNVNQPSGSQGALTLSGDGYLVPDDLTDIQQRNVQKIINKLKSENVFTPDSNDTQS